LRVNSVIVDVVNAGDVVRASYSRMEYSDSRDQSEYDDDGNIRVQASHCDISSSTGYFECFI
jgi:hypothetical protein